MIKTVIRCANDMVMVFDKQGEQLPEYQGQYQKVKGKICRDAPPGTIFGYFSDRGTELELVPREEW
jgi:hypothetical protein